MKSGNNVQRIRREVKIDLRQYDDMHSEEGCSGVFKPVEVKDAHLTMDGLGPVGVPVVPTIQCSKCEATFVFPGFQDFLEEVTARYLVMSPTLINKRQAKFLRLFFDKTQQEVANRLTNGDRHYYCKLESLNSDCPLDIDKQVRLKTLYAEWMEIKDADALYAINTLNTESPEAKLEPEQFKAAAENFIHLRA